MPSEWTTKHPSHTKQTRWSRLETNQRTHQEVSLIPADLDHVFFLFFVSFVCFVGAPSESLRKRLGIPPILRPLRNLRLIDV